MLEEEQTKSQRTSGKVGLTVPYLGDSSLGGEDEVEHEAHDGPADEDGNGALDSALLALQRSTLGVDDGMVLRLVVAFYPGRKGSGVGAGAQKAVSQGKRDNSSNGEEEEGVESAMLIIAVIGRHDGQTAAVRM